MTSPRKSRSTLWRVEKAAMAQFYRFLKRYGTVEAMLRVTGTGDELIMACAAHAAAKAKRGKEKKYGAR